MHGNRALLASAAAAFACATRASTLLEAVSAMLTATNFDATSAWARWYSRRASASWAPISAICAWALANWARASLSSSVNSSWPALTSSPSRKLTVITVPVTCGRMSTKLIGTTCPCAASSIGISRVRAVTVLTSGALFGAAGAAWPRDSQVVAPTPMTAAAMKITTSSERFGKRMGGR
jgi:hypothetical protein